MSSFQHFKEYYQTISDTALLEILDCPEDYQPVAVEAAKVELARRQLTDQALDQARIPIIAKKRKAEKEKEQLKAVEKKIKAVGDRFIDTINPIQSGIPTAEKTIRFIVIVFGGLFLYDFVRDFLLSQAYINDLVMFPVETMIIVLPKLLLGVAVFLFWRRKPIGWILLSSFLSISAVLAFWGLYETITWKPSGVSHLDNFFAPVPVTTHLIQLIFLLSSLYVLSRPIIREKYAISKDSMLAAIGIPGMGVFALMYFVVAG